MNIRRLTKITFSFVEFYHVAKTLETTEGLSPTLSLLASSLRSVLNELDATATNTEIEKSEMDVIFPLTTLEELTYILAVRKPSEDHRVGLNPAVTHLLASALVDATVQAQRAEQEIGSTERLPLVRSFLFKRAEAERAKNQIFTTTGIGPDDDVRTAFDANLN